MVSALTRAGAAVTLDALDRGAVDYVAKPEHGAERQVGVRGRVDRTRFAPRPAWTFAA